jgi:hypothetical protein
VKNEQKDEISALQRRLDIAIAQALEQRKKYDEVLGHLGAALKFAEHRNDCHMWPSNADQGAIECTCGLDDLRRAAYPCWCLRDDGKHDRQCPHWKYEPLPEMVLNP